MIVNVRRMRQDLVFVSWKLLIYVGNHKIQSDDEQKNYENNLAIYYRFRFYRKWEKFEWGNEDLYKLRSIAEIRRQYNTKSYICTNIP